MTCRLAIANAPESTHETIINVQQAGAQTQWVIKPGQATEIIIHGPAMDVVCAEGNFVGQLAIEGAVTRQLPHDRVVDSSAAEVIKGQRRLGRFQDDGFNSDW
jgi:hypothetical protein